jgi:acetylornithine deacetylase/succinyl-diaminopimelate desuccinylase-like protein
MRRTVMYTLIALASVAMAAGALADTAVDRLRTYIRVDTTNPPGNESSGVQFFAKIFDEYGINYETAESSPGRGNIWARIEGGRKPGLVLLNHMDVVTADPAYWSVNPFGGEIRDGHIYGRGAIDMKGTAIVQLEAFLALHASGQKPNRDVIFLATADEEAGGAYGAGWLVEKRPEVFKGVGFLLNEGGGGRAFPSGPAFSIGVTEKVPLWLRITAVGPPGHGSSPRAETATTRLLRAGTRVADTAFDVRVIDPVAALFAGLAQFQSGQRASTPVSTRSCVIRARSPVWKAAPRSTSSRRKRSWRWTAGYCRTRIGIPSSESFRPSSTIRMSRSKR